MSERYKSLTVSVHSNNNNSSSPPPSPSSRARDLESPTMPHCVDGDGAPPHSSTTPVVHQPPPAHRPNGTRGGLTAGRLLARARQRSGLASAADSLAGESTIFSFLTASHEGGGLLQSFHQTSDRSELMQQWSVVLERHGLMPAVDADRVADILANAKLPSPTHDALVYLNHDFLKSIGMDLPGDRARVLLAASRIPPPVKVQVNDDAHHRMRLRTAMGDKSSTYTADTHIVTMHTMRPTNKRWTWIDLVGSDVASRDPAYPLSEIARRTAELKRMFSADVIPPGEHGNTTTTEDAAVIVDSPIHICDTMAPEQFKKANSPSQPGDDSSSSARPKDVWSIGETILPLPHMVVSDTDPTFAGFVLRVCTLGTQSSDATISSLTNRWMVFVDVSRQLIATVHRVDSVALASLRDRHFGQSFDRFTFEDVLAAVLYNFLQEFEVALDESNALLDKCEVVMLDSRRQGDLLENLFHLERKASVYERMIDLNQSLIHEVAGYFSLLRDLSVLEGKWTQLREKSVALQERSTNLLQLLLALSGHRVNEWMALLTKFSIIFTPLTLIAGIYGMNFDNMPELKYENGYFICLGAMVFVLLALVVWMRLYGI